MRAEQQMLEGYDLSWFNKAYEPWACACMGSGCSFYRSESDRFPEDECYSTYILARRVERNRLTLLLKDVIKYSQET